MNAIYKYELASPGKTSLAIPRGGKILSVGNQSENLVMWVLVDTLEDRNDFVDIRAFETGQEIDDCFLDEDCKFLGTVVFESGHYVVHVFRT